jgi:hypothetical protein
LWKETDKTRRGSRDEGKKEAVSQKEESNIGVISD